MTDEAGPQEHVPRAAPAQGLTGGHGPRGGEGTLAAARPILQEADQLLAESSGRGLVLKLAGSAGVLRHCAHCRQRRRRAWPGTAAGP